MANRDCLLTWRICVCIQGFISHALGAERVFHFRICIHERNVPCVGALALPMSVQTRRVAEITRNGPASHLADQGVAVALHSLPFRSGIVRLDTRKDRKRNSQKGSANITSANAAQMEMTMNTQQFENLSREQLIALLAKAKAANNRALSCKVSEKGGVSVYGLGRFPVSLYLSQWEKLIEFVKAGHVEEFINDHRAELSVKD